MAGSARSSRRSKSSGGGGSGGGGFSSLRILVGWAALLTGFGLIVLHIYIVNLPEHGRDPHSAEGRANAFPASAAGRRMVPIDVGGGSVPAPSGNGAERPSGRDQEVSSGARNVPVLRGKSQPQPQRPPPSQELQGSAKRMHHVGKTEELLEWEASDENNAPFPGPRPGDTEERSQMPEILPGADSEHMHGLLGRSDSGEESIPPTPLPPGGLTNDDRRDAHRGFCFNSRVSDSLSLDRHQSEVRSNACQKLHSSYKTMDLPTASVVIVFHNEAFSILVRSIHTVLNHAPPHLLKEVIVVDDASVPVEDRFYEKHWKRLQEELRDHLMKLPKVLLVRVKERRGLMVARMEGIWRASAEVTVFLDSHIEATPGYLEPMLARIKETDGKSVVVPSIDTIGAEDFHYRQGGGLTVLGFSWTLGQMPTSGDNGPDGTRAARSPVMAGGLLASDRKWFLKLGGYDLDMRLYGGEEMEIGFRTWMCGGAIEYVPCSHIGHVFRTPAYWQGQVYKVPGEEISRNKLRTAKVWMDDYSKLVEYATAPLPESLPIGDLSGRQELRSKLQCKDFNWYIQEVVPNMFAPKLSSDAKGGCLRNKVRDACVDTLGGSGKGQELATYPCHFQHGTQALVLDSDGLVRLPQTGYRECMAVSGDKVVQTKCSSNPSKLWTWEESTGLFKLRNSDNCLTFVDKQHPKSPFSVGVQACSEDTQEQIWTWC
mmetsp:Transcript_4701/g.10134  ORF Transcript_4701/g.10134 Transcript_4701/m.10134 type:complete len:712 (+) Transcript_4701:33-2168(+)